MNKVKICLILLKYSKEVCPTCDNVGTFEYGWCSHVGDISYIRNRVDENDLLNDENLIFHDILHKKNCTSYRKKDEQS